MPFTVNDRSVEGDGLATVAFYWQRRCLEETPPHFADTPAAGQEGDDKKDKDKDKEKDKDKSRDFRL